MEHTIRGDSVKSGNSVQAVDIRLRVWHWCDPKAKGLQGRPENAQREVTASTLPFGKKRGLTDCSPVQP
jgi:hypothetical protein